MLDRKSVFEAWRHLGSEVQSLGGVIQNPTDNLTVEDRRQWEEEVRNVENKFRSLVASTQCLLQHAGRTQNVSTNKAN